MTNIFDVEKLKRILLEKKLTQAEFAKRLGVTPSAVSRYMVGKSLPSSKTLLKMANVLGLSVENLLEKEEVITNTDLVNMGFAKLWLRFFLQVLNDSGIDLDAKAKVSKILNERINVFMDEPKKDTLVKLAYLNANLDRTDKAMVDLLSILTNLEESPTISDNEKK